jgi:PAS domain S-box-containing protein
VTLSIASNYQPLTMLRSESDFAIGPAFDAVDIGIIVLDRRECIVAWNDWMACVSRQEKSAVLGKNLYEVFPSLRDTRLPAVIGDSFQVGSSSVLTHSLNTLLPLWGEDGQELLHNLIVRPVSSGRSDFCLLQINDVTVSVVRERVLRERQNARYHAIVDSAPDAIITTDIDGTIQWVNGAAEHVFGYASADLLGKKIDILLAHDGSLSRIFSDDKRTPEKALQVIGRRTHGSPGCFDVSFGRWRADERVFVTTIWRDVTERMAADAALRESESRHRALLEALPQLVWSCGSDGACDYFNPQWEGYTGASADQHRGWEWLKVVHEEDRDSLEAKWRTSLTTEAVFDVDARLRRSDGEYRWFKMRSIPVHGVGGGVTKWFGTATDITDHIEARDALRNSNEELELRVAERTREREVALRQLHESQKMESIGQLTGGVAHDFNNLLAVILGSLALLKKAIPEGARATALLERAIQGAERGATLTARLLAFARRQELKVEVVSLQDLIPDMLDFLRHSVGPAISVGVDIPPEVEPVEVDANQLELALMNLAVNARDAMPQGGTLTITCRNGFGSQANGLPRGDYVQICVADSGEGMSEATLARAKEPFFTTKGIGKGTGLGLSMVHGFTAQSGGAMDIGSQLGKGTVVTLWLPRARGIAQSKPETKGRAPAPPKTVKNLRVLLVDDDILVSMGAADMLIDLGHSVVEAQSAAHAFKLLVSECPFDVVVTDYAMPGMNGYDLAVKLQQAYPRLPVVLATGYAELPTKTAIEFRRLAKPYSQADMAAALELAVNNSC